MEVLNSYKDKPDPTDTYIGRGSPLGNKFVIGRDGCRLTVIAKYRTWLKERLLERDSLIETAFRNLTENSKLVCFCAPAPCHGDVILSLKKFFAGYADYEDGLKALRFQLSGNAYEPLEDGITHINIYSKGATRLGRALTNLSPLPLEHPTLGKFATMEGYYFYISTGYKHEELRTLDGYGARAFGRTKERIKIDGFETLIEEGVRLKIDQNEVLKKYFTECKLPYTHYYFYGTKENPKIIQLPDYKWYVDIFERYRKELQPRSYKLIIAGSRGVTDYEIVKKAYLLSELEATCIVSGTAAGVDTLGEQLATELGYKIDRYPADWEFYGKRAGYIRNCEMAQDADGLLAIWDGASKGTKHVIEYMRSLGKTVKVFNTKKNAFV